MLHILLIVAMQTELTDYVVPHFEILIGMRLSELYTYRMFVIVYCLLVGPIPGGHPSTSSGVLVCFVLRIKNPYQCITILFGIC